MVVTTGAMVFAHDDHLQAIGQRGTEHAGAFGKAWFGGLAAKIQGEQGDGDKKNEWMRG